MRALLTHVLRFPGAVRSVPAAAATRAMTPRTATRVRILDSVAEGPRYDDDGDHYEEDPVKPVVLSPPARVVVVDKPT